MEPILSHFPLLDTSNAKREKLGLAKDRLPIALILPQLFFHCLLSPSALLQQDLTQAKRAVSFYVKIVNFHDMRKDKVWQLAPLSLDNIQTGEKLVITKIDVEKEYSYRSKFDLAISRFPIGTNEEEWHCEMAQYSDSHRQTRWGDDLGQYSKKEYRNIVIDV